MLTKAQKKEIEQAERHAVDNIWESFSWHVDQLSIESPSVCSQIINTKKYDENYRFNLVDELTQYGREMVIKILKKRWGIK
jgi:hypothetical protein